MRIAITGASGLVGSRIVELLGQNFEFIEISQKEIDITEEKQVADFLKKIDFDLFLHLAAYTDVDAAEKNKDLAYKINVEGTKNVFNLVQERGKKFIYISTGFVFDGITPPYDEDSSPHPLSVYGQTKYQGEQVVKDKAMIVRIEYPYRSHYTLKPDLVVKIKDRLTQSLPVDAVTDNLITPTFIDDIANGLKYLMINYSPETFHLVGQNSLSSFDFSQIIAKKFGLNSDLIKPISAVEYFKNRAVRPLKAVVTSRKNSYWPMKTFEQGLDEIKKQLSL